MPQLEKGFYATLKSDLKNVMVDGFGQKVWVKGEEVFLGSDAVAHNIAMSLEMDKANFSVRRDVDEAPKVLAAEAPAAKTDTLEADKKPFWNK